jgi:hypothetical protein
MGASVDDLMAQEAGGMDSRDSLNNSAHAQNTKVAHDTGEMGKLTSDNEGNNGEGRERLVGNATLFSTVTALLIKRFHLYKRDKTAICCEVVVPFMCVLIGVALNQIDFSQKSYTLLVEPDMYPTPQRIGFNEVLPFTTSGDTNVDPKDFFNNLPGSGSDFTVTYLENIVP